MKNEKATWAILRISLGLIFLWAFFDKLLGLGFATASDKSWILGVSPTAGFLEFGTRGPFMSIFQAMAGSLFIDWIFMLGLLLIGIALILGIGIRIAGYSGALMMLFMWFALLPPEHHPLLDEHIIYLIALLGLTFSNSGDSLGLGKRWKQLEIVKKYPILE